MTTTSADASPIQIKYVALATFVLAALFVLYQRDLQLLDPNSFLRHRYAGIGWLILRTEFLGRSRSLWCRSNFRAAYANGIYKCIGLWGGFTSSASLLPLPLPFQSPLS